MPSLTLSVLGQQVGFTSKTPDVMELLEVAYGHMVTRSAPGELRFEIDGGVGTSGDGWPRVVRGTGGKSFTAIDPGDFLVELEVALTIELQRRRPDLYFVHSAVLENNGAAVMLAGQPGSGKSTTCWALLHRGFRYLSDELGPTEVESGAVHPYSRGLVLKRDPPVPFVVSRGALRTSRTIHVPVSSLPAKPHPGAVRLATLVLLNYRGPGYDPSLERVSSARAGAQLYTHALNALAHPGDGLDAAIGIAKRAACYELVSSDFEDSCALIEEACLRA